MAIRDADWNTPENWETNKDGRRYYVGPKVVLKNVSQLEAWGLGYSQAINNAIWMFSNPNTGRGPIIETLKKAKVNNSGGIDGQRS